MWCAVALSDTSTAGIACGVSDSKRIFFPKNTTLRTQAQQLFVEQLKLLKKHVPI
jgi:hypothetical protein